ncbi:receptor-like protein EIX2 [Malus sylvestris]|uniref:receptor-like protein EIX2 n=1 Tax=Malus sylvestris TaxID=3752 RepID=UPI0021ABE062|nr:receptor-like protein EIX2 [Malus sylvestris]
MARVMTLVSLLTFLLSIASFTLTLCNRNLNLPPCKENERRALLMFKKDLIDSSNLLSSWVGEGDCCTWTGVACDNVTAHVRELHLAGNYDQVTGEEHTLGGKGSTEPFLISWEISRACVIWTFLPTLI